MSTHGYQFTAVQINMKCSDGNISERRYPSLLPDLSNTRCICHESVYTPRKTCVNIRQVDYTYCESIGLQAIANANIFLNFRHSLESQVV